MTDENNQNTAPMESKYMTSEEQELEKQKSDTKSAKKTFTFKPKTVNFNNLLPKILDLGRRLKSPKILAIVVLILIILVGVGTFLQLSSKSNYVQNVDIVDLPQKSPETKADAALEDIQKQVDAYGKELGSLKGNLGDTPFPKVDLKIEF